MEGAEARVFTEENIESMLAAVFTRRGISYQRQVRVPSGIIDILTTRAIFEVKEHLSLNSMRSAMAQLYTYALEVKPYRQHLVIIGQRVWSTPQRSSFFTRLGVHVVSIGRYTGRWQKPLEMYVSTASLPFKKRSPAVQRNTRNEPWLPFDANQVTVDKDDGPLTLGERADLQDELWARIQPKPIVSMESVCSPPEELAHEMEELFTTEQVAERLKVRQRTVKRWLLSGQLRGLKAGRKWRVKPSAIEQFLQVSKEIGHMKS